MTKSRILPCTSYPPCFKGVYCSYPVHVLTLYVGCEKGKHLSFCSLVTVSRPAPIALNVEYTTLDLKTDVLSESTFGELRVGSVYFCGWERCGHLMILVDDIQPCTDPLCRSKELISRLSGRLPADNSELGLPHQPREATSLSIHPSLETAHAASTGDNSEGLPR